MLFWPSMITGVSPNFIDNSEMIRYSSSPIDLKSIRFDWMLDNVAEDDKQPYSFRLMNEILKRDMVEQE